MKLRQRTCSISASSAWQSYPKRTANESLACVSAYELEVAAWRFDGNYGQIFGVILKPPARPLQPPQQ